VRLATLICWLHDWQDLAGAAVGAVMGFAGAYVVASNVERREQRNAARLMLMDASLLERRYKRIKADAERATKPYRDWLPGELLLDRYELSPLFASQAAQVLDVSIVLSICLTLLTDTHRQIGEYLRAIEAEREANAPIAAKERDLLVTKFEELHSQCRFIMFLLMPIALTLRRRVWLRLRRRFRPTSEEREIQQQLARIRKTAKEQNPS